MSLVTDKDLAQNISGSTSIRIMNTCNILGFNSHLRVPQLWPSKIWIRVQNVCSQIANVNFQCVWEAKQLSAGNQATYGNFDPGFQNLPSDNFLGCTHIFSSQSYWNFQQGSKFVVFWQQMLPCFIICYRDFHVVANICYCHKFMVLLI